MLKTYAAFQNRRLCMLPVQKTSKQYLHWLEAFTHLRLEFAFN